ncbi:MAG: 30S ribosome-binding factor RbfA [Hyphomicrobiales bacterium]|nr:MAG: 30S ribosome-binding factor RbfA [Hyphomicrobiales bacterium]
MARPGNNKISKEPTQRQLRVGEIVRRAIDGTLRRGEIRVPELERMMITVPEVRMSPDLRNASIYVAPLGGGDGDALASLLNTHRKAVRGSITKDLSMKFMPNLKFFADNSYDEATKIDRLLRQPKVLADLQAPDTPDDE